MRLFGLASILLIVFAIAEIVVFVLLAKAIGLGWAILIALATSLLGAFLLRREGARGWRRFRAAVTEGRPPGREATDGLTGLLGALLLLAPGFIGDAIGLLLLAPPLRALARAGVRRAAETRFSPAVAGQVFGPKLVRARRGPRVHDTPPASHQAPPNAPLVAGPGAPAAGAPGAPAAGDGAGRLVARRCLRGFAGWRFGRFTGRLVARRCLRGFAGWRFGRFTAADRRR
jgi:UPF0716 protein FxsA